MSSRNILVVESEKSPKVVSTNWKENVVHQRNMQILDRSQRTVINRIVVDQKILNKRFQTKLARSKMAWAKTTANMELQKRLKQNSTFVLNTNVGNNEIADDILKRVWERGRRTYQHRLENDIYRKKTTQIGTFTAIEDNSPTESGLSKTPNIPDRAYTGLNLRPDTVVTIQKYALPKRPVTSVGQKPKRPSIETNVQEQKSQVQDDMEAIEKKPRPQTAVGFVTSVSVDDGDKDSKKPKKSRPSTATGGFLQTVNDMIEPPKSPTHKAAPSRVHSSRVHPAGNAGIGSMFEDDEFQISLLDFQRFRVYSAGYESRVKRYGENIQSLKQGDTMDYYTAKLQSDLAKHPRRKFQMEAARDATVEDVKRATGDLSVRSLTLRTPMSLIDMQNV